MWMSYMYCAPSAAINNSMGLSWLWKHPMGTIQTMYIPNVYLCSTALAAGECLHSLLLLIFSWLLTLLMKMFNECSHPVFFTMYLKIFQRFQPGVILGHLDWGKELLVPLEYNKVSHWVLYFLLSSCNFLMLLNSMILYS